MAAWMAVLDTILGPLAAEGEVLLVGGVGSWPKKTMRCWGSDSYGATIGQQDMKGWTFRSNGR